MVRVRGAVCGFAWMLCGLAPGLRAQGALAHPTARNWAWDKVKAITAHRRDPATGQYRWIPFLQLSPSEQNERLLTALHGNTQERRAALLVLADRPLSQWVPQALKSTSDPAELGLFLQARSYRSPGADPLAHLGGPSRLDRPWTHGLGLHLEADAWRLQWIPAPSLLPHLEGGSPLPPALDLAPQPGALLHLKQLLPGLRKLRDLGGGPQGLAAALAGSGRLGFLSRHLEPWFTQAAPALGPLAEGEAWILHYGLPREEGPSGGTLLFLPGELPTRTKLALELLKLNPSSKGARSRSLSWEGPGGAKAELTQLRASGGVLHLWTTPQGTWICDRESTLRALIFPGPTPTLGERPEWGRLAQAGARNGTELSLWILPRLGADARFEGQLLRRRLLGEEQKTWTNPAISKAAPRGGTLTLSLGAGPTEQMLQAILRVDRNTELKEPTIPAFSEGGQRLSPEQLRAFQAEVEAVRRRNQNLKALRGELSGLVALLDLRGAALTWRGWTPLPPLSAPEKQALTEFRKLQKESPRAAARLQREQGLAFFGGFGEPGLSPALALSLPIQQGRQTEAEAQLRKLWPRLFTGEAQKRSLGGATLYRVRTPQAFAPSYAVMKDHLVLATDDRCLQEVVEGLQGRLPTLADLPQNGFGRAELDGARLAEDLEGLLLAYLRANRGNPFEGTDAAGQDEASTEVAESFGPFLAALRSLGRRTVQLDFGPGGLEIRPK